MYIIYTIYNIYIYSVYVYTYTHTCKQMEGHILNIQEWMSMVGKMDLEVGNPETKKIT